MPALLDPPGPVIGLNPSKGCSRVGASLSPEDRNPVSETFIHWLFRILDGWAKSKNPVILFDQSNCVLPSGEVKVNLCMLQCVNIALFTHTFEYVIVYYANIVTTSFVWSPILTYWFDSISSLFIPFLQHFRWHLSNWPTSCFVTCSCSFYHAFYLWLWYINSE
jgi:hypothetical protein